MDPAILEMLRQYWSEALAVSSDIEAVRTTAFLLAVAIPLSWLIVLPHGLTKHLPRPADLFRAPAAFLDRKLNRRERSHRNRLIRGAIVGIFILLLGLAVGGGLDWLVKRVPGGWIVELAILLLFLSPRRLFGDAWAVERALKKKDSDKARKLTHPFARSRALKRMDVHAIARLAIEHLGGRLTERLAAPAFLYLILGLTGLFGYIALRAVDLRIGHDNKTYEDFGFIPAKLDDAAHWLPARLAGIAFAIAACFQPKANPVNALRIMIRDAEKHPSPKSGFGEAAVAGAFDYALEGPRVLAVEGASEPKIQKRAWLGDGRARLGPNDIAVTRGLFALANLVLWIPVVLFAAAIG